MKRIYLALAATLAAVSLGHAQSYKDSGGTVVRGVVPLAGCSAGACAPISNANPLPVSGSFNANLGSFQPSGVGAPLGASTASSRVALPAGTTVVVYNTGANAAYVAFGGSAVTASNTNALVQPGSWQAFGVTTETHLAAITASGATTLNVIGGTGLPSGAGGVGGSAGSVTQANVSVTNASTTVLAAAAATNFVKLCVALGAGAGVWVRWDGGTATLAAPAEYLAPGACASWVKSTGYLPTSQINAIAAATVAVSLIYN